MSSFTRDDLRKDLKKKSLRGGLNLIGGEGGEFFLRMASTAILARLLLPEHFGIIGMIIVLTGLAKVFKDLGLSDATIQHEELDDGKVSTLFWINSLFGFFLMVVVAALSPAIAWFYNDPRLAGVSALLSLSFFFSGLGVQHQALLSRKMMFGSVALINIASLILGSAVGIVLAFMGFEYWALAWKEISTIMFITAGSWIAYRWMPSRPSFAAGTGSLLRFGRDVSLVNLVRYFGGSVDKILIGKIWGPGPLGLYIKAYQLMLLPMTQIRFPITRVGLSGLSALQNEPDKYRQYFSELLTIIAFLYMPVVVYLGLEAESVILIVLGNNWGGAINIFRMLAVASFIIPVAGIADLVLLTQGNTGRYLTWGTVHSVCAVISFFAGIKWGVIGIAAAYTLVQYLLFLPSLYYRLHGTHVDFKLFVRSFFTPAAASLLMGGVLFLMMRHLTFTNMVIELLITLPVCAATYIALWCLLPSGRERIRKYYSHVFYMLGREKVFSES